MMKSDAIIVSAGRGQRFMPGRKKQFHLLADKPILAHTVEKFETCHTVQSIVLVVAQEDMDYCLEEIVEKFGYRKVCRIVPGGKLRQESVKNGIDSLPRDSDIVAIHDGVRPFVTREMIEESIHAAARFQAVVLAMPVKDTIKMVHPDGTVLKTLDRESIWQIQTPQTFQVNVIKEAYQQATREGFIGTDDATLVERLGVKVHVLPGAYSNIKITTLEDLTLANFFLEKGFTDTDQSGRREEG